MLAFKLLNQLLGSGSSSRVFAAVNLSTGQKVACKKYDLTDSTSGYDLRQTARKEAAILERLSTQYVPAPIAFSETSSSAYLFLELLSGSRTLAKALKQSGGVFDEERARVHFRQLVDAIEHLHYRGIVHRDIKLENILIDPSGQTKIIDFGLSDYLFEDEAGQADGPGRQERVFEEYCGSPVYVAPEVCQNQPYRGRPVDVWSLGVLLYKMILGRFPFAGESPSMIFSRIVTAPLEFSPRRSISLELRDLLLLLLEKNPEKRATLDDIRNHPWMLGA
jgi:serine/threonine protein kinase